MERILLKNDFNFEQMEELCSSSNELLVDEWKEIAPVKVK